MAAGRVLQAPPISRRPVAIADSASLAATPSATISTVVNRPSTTVDSALHCWLACGCDSNSMASFCRACNESDAATGRPPAAASHSGNALARGSTSLSGQNWLLTVALAAARGQHRPERASPCEGWLSQAAGTDQPPPLHSACLSFPLLSASRHGWGKGGEGSTASPVAPPRATMAPPQHGCLPCWQAPPAPASPKVGSLG